MTDKPIQLSDEQKNERDKIKKYGDGDLSNLFLLYHSDMINKKYLEKLKDLFILLLFYELQEIVGGSINIQYRFSQSMDDLGDKFLNTNPTLSISIGS